MKLHLRRTYLDDATIGVLSVEGEQFATLEDIPGPAGITNTCVPEGRYVLEPHNGARFKGTYALVNERLGVTHWPAPGKRSACVIHSGNTTEHTQGCLLVGLGISLAPQPALLRSLDGTRRLLELLSSSRDPEHSLLVEGG